jgi:error-prone DNA polymerase
VVDQKAISDKHNQQAGFNNYTQGIAIRLGLCLVKGLNLKSANALIEERASKNFQGMADLKQRFLNGKRISQGDLQALVHANAMHGFDLHRRSAQWHALAVNSSFGELEPSHDASFLTPPSAVQEMQADYQSMRLSLQHHPLALLRNQAPFNRCCLANRLLTKRNKGLIEVAGVVTGRQRPGSASGVIFMTLEDETGNINVVLWQSVQQRFKQEILTGRLLYIKGQIEHSDGVANIIAGYIQDHSSALPALDAKSRDFH